jgi:hypothetical protein
MPTILYYWSIFLMVNLMPVVSQKVTFEQRWVWELLSLQVPLYFLVTIVAFMPLALPPSLGLLVHPHRLWPQFYPPGAALIESWWRP